MEYVYLGIFIVAFGSLMGFIIHKDEIGYLRRDCDKYFTQLLDHKYKIKDLEREIEFLKKDQK